MNDLAFHAMCFARKAHAAQVRKYTGGLYADHLAEVAGITATVLGDEPVALATAWLHDYVEDINPESGAYEVGSRFGKAVAEGVAWLTDNEVGNRAERKAASRARLAAAPDWVQTIKCADLISNTSSIVRHDPNFAVVYLREKRALLEVMAFAHPKLRQMAIDLSLNNAA